MLLFWINLQAEQETDEVYAQITLYPEENVSTYNSPLTLSRYFFLSFVWLPRKWILTA